MGSGARRSGRIRRRTAPGPKLGDDVDGGCSGPFWSRETSRRSREALRSSGKHRGGERGMVAAANGVGGDGLRSARAGREAEEETGFRGREGRCRGRGEVRGVTRGLGEEAGGGQSGVEVARTAASRCPRPSGEEEDDRGVAVAGWAGWGTGPAGGLHGWHQVSPSLSFISISVLFYFI